MDRHLEAYDWSHTNCRPHEDGVSECKLESLKLSISPILSAWGIYLIMIAGLALFSALFSPDVHDFGSRDVSGATQGEIDGSAVSRASAGLQP